MHSPPQLEPNETELSPPQVITKGQWYATPATATANPAVYHQHQQQEQHG